MVSTSSQLGKIKGNAFREFLIWYEEARGAAPLTAALKALPADLRADLTPGRPALGVLASTWYDATLVHALLDELARDHSESEVQRMVEEAARVTMKAMMRGVQKVAFDLLISPARLPKVINLIWRMTYDSGTISISSTDDKCHQSVVTEWGGHHPLICRINMHAAIAMYEAMGCRNVRQHRVACISLGHPDCRSILRWSSVGSARE